jgi:serine/threonine-protein kinase HipA
MEALDVYLNGVKAGVLCDDNGRMDFAYTAEYLSDIGSEPISYSLPLRKEAYSHAEVEPVFSNLLPDDIIRTRIGAILKIPRENTFALLKAIGGDCAGAVAFFQQGEPIEVEGKRGFRALTDEEAGHILDSLEDRPLDVGEEGFRISGAGAQDKLIACVSGGKVILPLYGSPSTHIIKTEIRGYPESVENEWFAMSLGAACGLKVAECEIMLIGGKRRFVCRRYDREMSGGDVCRLHQEDFCQLLRIDPKNKYESLGGPGILDSFSLLRRLSLPASDTLELLNRMVFNFIVGNGDAHGKNFSILYRNGVAELAPMYDVMSTTVYPEVGKRMAMKIDGEYAFRWITYGKFLRVADKLGIGEKIMHKSLETIVRKVTRNLQKVIDDAQNRWPSDCYCKIADGIHSRIAQIFPQA